MKRLSIVIVTYNSEKDIYDCLQSIYSNSDIPQEDLEVIVVDNGSRNCSEMFSRIRDEHNDVILLENTHNGGYGQGNNVGISHSSAPIVMIMNPDVRLIEPVFSKVLRAYDGDDSLGIYGMKEMLDEKRDSHHSYICTYMMNGYLWVLLTGLTNRMNMYFQKWQYIHGACFFVRKEMFNAIGGFDESIFMYGEEDDIRCRMLAKYGKCIKYDSTLHFVHKSEGRKPNVEYEKTLVEVALKNHKKVGYPKESTIRNFIRITRLQMLIEKIKIHRGKSDERYKVLQELMSYLRQINV